jgi:hypothetical protein
MIQKVLDSKFQVKTFSVKYNKELSKRAKIVLQSFKLKFYYYVIDDILYFLKSDSNECNCLLEILNSTAIFLQNNLSVNFFDIYVYDIQINEISKTNRFTRGEQETVKISNTITIKLAYQVQPLEEILDNLVKKFKSKLIN